MRVSVFALAFALLIQQPQAPTHPTSAPYTGDLSVFEDPQRDAKLQVDRVMDTLGLKAGSMVADIGAGGGWFSVWAARRVGTTGKVIAEDINPRAVESIRQRAAREKLPQIVPVQGTPDDPKLEANSLDAALMLRAYHEVARPPVLLAHLRDAMRPGAKFAVIDHPGHGSDHGIDAAVVRKEVEHSGLVYVGLYDFTKGDQNDYMIVFRKP